MFNTNTTFQSHYAHNVRTLSLEEIQRKAPSVFAVQPAEKMSDRYTLIPTSEVLKGLMGEGFMPVSASQQNVRIPGRENFAKHLIRLRHRDTLDQQAIVGDTVPELVILNSHDGTSSYQIHAGMFRFVCANGLVVADSLLQRHSVRHTGDIVDNVIEAAYEIVREVPALMDKVQQYQGITLDQGEAEALAKAALTLRYDPEKGEHVPVQPKQLLVPRRRGDTGEDLWSRFNVVQERMLRGGVPGISKKGGRTRTREVKSIDQNVKLNKALWTLADEMAKLKGATC